MFRNTSNTPTHPHHPWALVASDGINGILTRVVGFPQRGLWLGGMSCGMPGRAKWVLWVLSGCSGPYPLSLSPLPRPLPRSFPVFPSRRPFRSPNRHYCSLPVAGWTLLLPPTTTHPPLPALTASTNCSHHLLASTAHPPITVITHARMPARLPVPHRVNHRPTDYSPLVSVSMLLLPVSHGQDIRSHSLCMYSGVISQ